MNAIAINTRNISAFALAISIVSITSVFATILISHILMAIIIIIWSIRNAPNSLIFVVTFLGSFLLYMIFISEYFGLGERYIVEGVKIVLLILFIAAMQNNIEFAKNSLLYLSIIICIFLAGYVIISPDPFVYGGRLGILIDESTQNAMISANTIGLALNICLATIISKGYRPLYFLIPIIMILLFFTYSRGALTCLSAVIVVYLIRTGKTFGAFLILLFSIILFSGTFSDLFYTLRFDDYTGSGRIDLYQFMYDRIVSQPLSVLTGFGPGAIYFEISYGSALISAHSGYLEMIYTFGIFGLVATLAFLFKTIKNFKTLPLDSLLYAVLILAYAISEDMLGSHALFVFGLMLGIILNDFGKGGERKRLELASQINFHSVRTSNERQ